MVKPLYSAFGHNKPKAPARGAFGWYKRPIINEGYSPQSIHENLRC
ncbi:hypothetical protein Vspart_04387 [Vibrio spartinae]|uniref:Uncharacterized protein n=1 Tax=Vibrio spartinae TaxID=1918945 RepID=A0ABX6R8Q9_9VIBR|nr:hypothetical protein Vspart_04387 [Vibrio spartinae]